MSVNTLQNWWIATMQNVTSLAAVCGVLSKYSPQSSSVRLWCISALCYVSSIYSWNRPYLPSTMLHERNVHSKALEHTSGFFARFWAWFWVGRLDPIGLDSRDGTEYCECVRDLCLHWLGNWNLRLALTMAQVSSSKDISVGKKKKSEQCFKMRLLVSFWVVVLFDDAGISIDLHFYITNNGCNPSLQ